MIIYLATSLSLHNLGRSGGREVEPLLLGPSTGGLDRVMDRGR